MKNMNALSIDIGTSRVKCAVFDGNGVMLALHSIRLPRASSPDLQDAQVWIDTCVSLLKKMLAMPVCPEIDVVALTGNMHALLGVDANGKPLAPARLWCDNSAIAESDELNSRYKDAFLEKTGNVSTPVFTLAKLLKMKREQPELYSHVHKFLQSKDIVAHFLTGHFVTDPVDASGTLLMELQGRRWWSGMFSELGLDQEKMPDIVPSGEICGHVTEAAAQATGLKAGVPVVIGCGDLASAALGSGVDEDSMSLTLGTAGQLLATGSPGTGRKLAGQLFVFAHCDERRELFLGSVPGGGFSFEWLASLHKLELPEFFKLASDVLHCEELPVFMPYELGRGAPYMDYTPMGAWFGLNAKHGMPELCRAAILGVLCALRQSCDLLYSLDGARQRIVLQALAAREKAVIDSACALFSGKKYISDNGEASLLGAAMLGMKGIGVFPSLDEAISNMWHGMAYIGNTDVTGTDSYYGKYLAFAGKLGE